MRNLHRLPQRAFDNKFILPKRKAKVPALDWIIHCWFFTAEILYRGAERRNAEEISHRFTQMNTAKKQFEVLSYLCPSVFICGSFI